MKTYLEMACEHMKSVISENWDEWNVPNDIKETIGMDPLEADLCFLSYYLHTVFVEEDPCGFIYGSDENEKENVLNNFDYVAYAIKENCMDLDDQEILDWFLEPNYGQLDCEAKLYAVDEVLDEVAEWLQKELYRLYKNEA